MIQRDPMLAFPSPLKCAIWMMVIILSIVNSSADCKNGGLINPETGNCDCYAGFEGADCNTLTNNCLTKNQYNERCAPDSCVPVFNSIFCTACLNEDMKPPYCRRKKTDLTKIFQYPYFAYLPYVTGLDNFTILFSVEQFGDKFTLMMDYGDGEYDFRSENDFYIGDLREELQYSGIDAIAPGTAGYNAIPEGRRYIVKLYHTYPTVLRLRQVKLRVTGFNQPGIRKNDLQHTSPLILRPPPPGEIIPKLAIPKCWNSSLLWSRNLPLELQGEAQHPNGSVLPDDILYTFSITLNANDSDSQSRPPPSNAPPSRRFVMQPYSLPFGRHTLQFSAWRSGRLLALSRCTFHVVALPLAVVLVGGDERVVNPSLPLVLDASISVDLNEPDLSQVKFTWTCLSRSKENFCVQFTAEGVRAVVPPFQLKDGLSYVFVVDAMRPGLPKPVQVEQVVHVSTDIQHNIALVCERNCGKGGVVLSSEATVLHAECAGQGGDRQCPPLLWEVNPPTPGEPGSPAVNNTRRRFVIAGGMKDGLNYTVHISVGGKPVSQLVLSPAANMTVECNWMGGDSLRKRVSCRSAGGFRTSKLFEFLQIQGDDAILLAASVTGFTRLIGIWNTPFTVRAIDISGMQATAYLDNENTIISMKLEDALKTAQKKLQKGKIIEANSDLLAGLEWATGSPNLQPSQLLDVATLISEHIHLATDVSVWRQFAMITKKIGKLGLKKKGGTYPDDAAAAVGMLIAKLSHGLSRFARLRDPRAWMGTKEVFKTAQMFMEIGSPVIQDAGGQVAKEARKLPVDEAELDSEYPFYTDLVAGFIERQRKFRVAARGVVDTIGNIATALMWRMVPDTPPSTIKTDGAYFWSKVDTIESLSSAPQLLGQEAGCEVHVDASAAQPLQQQEYWGLSVAAMRGSPFWFEMVPPRLDSNTERSVQVLLRQYEDGPGAVAPQAPGLVRVALPIAPQEGRKSGRLQAQTDGSDWQRHIVVWALHAFRGTGHVQVIFSTPYDGMRWEVLALLQEKWPKPQDLLSPRAVRVKLSGDSTLSVGVAVTNRSNEFVHLALGLSKEALEEARRSGMTMIRQEYIFLPQTLQCNRWNNFTYKWESVEDKEVWRESSPTTLTCSLDHLSVFSGLVLVAPSFVHPIEDAKLFSQLGSNWIVFAYVMCCLVVWLVWLVIVRRRDRRDDQLWRVVVLEDCAPGARYPYLVTVFSGNLGRGQTTAHVGMRLTGERGDSGPHMLSHSGRLLNESFDDWFLLLTEDCLGPLQQLDLWTDCAGMNPYWYCEKVLVEDLITKEVWHFPGYRWLSLEHGSRLASATLETGDVTWRQRFLSLCKSSVRGDHIWTSIVFRHPRMTFTRSQRLTVAFTLHFLNMISSIMFYNALEPDESQSMTMSELLGRGIMISLEQCLITVPASILIVWIFQVEEVEAEYVAKEYPEGGDTLPVIDEFERRERRSRDDRSGGGSAIGRNAMDAAGAGRVSTPGDELAAGSPSQAERGSAGQEVRVEVTPPEPAPRPDSGQIGDLAVSDVLRPGVQPRGEGSRTSLRGRERSSSSVPRKRIGQSAYRSLRIRTERQRTGGPKIYIYLGGARRGPDAEAEAGRDAQGGPEQRDDSGAGARRVRDMEDGVLSVPKQEAEQDAAGKQPDGEIVSEVESSARVAPAVGHIPSEAGEASPLTPKPKIKKEGSARLSALRRPWFGRGRSLRLSPPEPPAPPQRPPARKDGRPWHWRFGRALWRVRQRRTWRILAGWVLCILTMTVCGYFTIMYGLKYGRSDSLAWLTATLLSLVLDIFVIQPAKIVALSFVFAFWYERDASLEKKQAPHSRAVRIPGLPEQVAEPCPYTKPEMYRPLTRTEAEVLLVLRKHRQRLTRRAFNTLIWLVWMVLMYWSLAGASDSLQYYMLKHVSGMVIDATHTRTRRFDHFSDVIKYKEVHEYLNRTVVGSLMWRKATPEATPEVLHPYVGFLKDNVSRVIGAIRLRQQRVKNESSCTLAEPFALPGLVCLSDFSSASADTDDHGEGWWRPPDQTDTELGQHSLSAWKYHSAWELDSFTMFGYDYPTRGGGYVVTLGRVPRNADMALRYLANNSWLDRHSRAVFIEFVVFSPYSNIFCDAYLTLERSPASSFHYSSKLYTYRLPWAAGNWRDAELTVLMLLLLVSFGILVREVIHMIRAGKEYLWNWFDVFLVLLIAANAIVFFTVNHVLGQLLARLHTLDQKVFFSFQSATRLHFAVTIGMGVMVVMSTVRCWRVLSFATHFKIVRIMLKLAYGPLLAMLFHLMLVQLQFTLLFLLLMGASYDSLHTVQRAFVLLLAYLVDYTANYEEFEEDSRDNPLSLISYWVFVAFMYFFFLNFFLSIVSLAFERAVEIVRQKEIEGFSISKLICDELRYLLHIPGGRLRRDSSLFRHVRKDFVTRNHRIHGDSRFVSIVEMGALNAIYKLSSGQPLSEREVDSAMAALVVNAVSPPEEMPTGGHEMLLSTGYSWDGEQTLDVSKLHHVMDTLNSRLGPETPHTVVDPENLLAISGLLREVVELRTRAPSAALAIRARRGQPALRPTARVAYLSVRRGRSAQVRLRLLRVPAAAAAAAASMADGAEAAARRRNRRSALVALAFTAARNVAAAQPASPQPGRAPQRGAGPGTARQPWRP